MGIFNWLKKYNVYVDATIFGIQDKKLSREAHISYFIEGLDIHSEKETKEYETNTAELAAILFALDELENKLKRFVIFCDHESVVSEINKEKINPKNKPKDLLEIRNRLRKNHSIKVKFIKINPAHTTVKKYVKDNKMNHE